MSRGHHITVDITGSTASPGLFLWRCSCGARREGYERWDLAESAGRDHAELSTEGRS